MKAPIAMNRAPSFTEHYVPREQGRVYARDYAGTGPAFVLMHGFPDNLHIYDDLLPYLVAAGRRVVTFDFLGFGASDKLPDATYRTHLRSQEGAASRFSMSLTKQRLILVVA